MIFELCYIEAIIIAIIAISMAAVALSLLMSFYLFIFAQDRLHLGKKFKRA